MGSAQGQSLAQPFAQGMQMGMEQQRVNLANRQLAMELALQPLRQTQMKQQNDLQALGIQNSLLQRDLRTKGLAAFNQMQVDLHDELVNGNVGDTLNKVVSYAQQHGVLWGTPEFQEMQQGLFKMKQEEDLAKARLTSAQARASMVSARTLAAMPEAAKYRTLANQAFGEGNQDDYQFFMQKSEEAAKSAMPSVQVFEGKHFLVNPKSGHVEPLDKSVTRSDFLAKQSAKYAADTGLDINQAADTLGKFYDEKIAPSVNQQPIVPATPSLAAPQTGTAAATAATAAQPERKIKVQAPDGKQYWLPQSFKEKAIKQGYKPLE